MISKIFKWVRPAPAVAIRERATAAVLVHILADLLQILTASTSTTMAQIAESHGPRLRIVSAAASWDGSCGRNGRMTYIGIARQTRGARANTRAIQMLALVLFLPRTGCFCSLAVVKG